VVRQSSRGADATASGVYVQVLRARECRERTGPFECLSRSLSEVVIDVNDVTERDAFIGVAARVEVPGLGARPCPGRLDRADQPDGRVAPLPSHPCGKSVPPPRPLRHRRNGGPACFLQVRRCRSPIRDRLRSFMSYVFSALGQENRRATSITCERRQSSATTARSQTTST
jgi:hypothetical protein